MAEKSPPDIVDWKFVIKVEYELTMLAEPERLDTSFCMKFETVPAAPPPPPPPPQAVSAVIDPASKRLRNFI
jgi:hypothetical protein